MKKTFSLLAALCFLTLLAALSASATSSAPPRSIFAQAAPQVGEARVTFSVTLPADTPPGDTIYVAGDFQGWDPGATPLTRNGLRASGTVTVTTDRNIEFKFTRGVWEKGEKAADCSEMANRAEVIVNDRTIEATVAKWADFCGGPAPGTGYDSRAHKVTFTSTVLGVTKEFYVYTPPNYSTQSTWRYPVVYLFRGHEKEWINKNEDGSRAGRNVIDEYEDLLAAGQVGPMILVFPGISSNNNAVSGMLTNFKMPQLTSESGVGTGRFEDYFKDELVPYVDAYYRTVANRMGRGVDGFSLGGYMSAKIAAKYPGMFRTVGLFDGTHFYADAGCQNVDEARDQTYQSNMFDPVFGEPRDNAYAAQNNGPNLVCNSTPEQMQSLYWMVQYGALASEPNNANYLRGEHLMEKLAAKGVTNRVPNVLEGGHNWNTADEHMRVTLPHHWQQLGPSGGPPGTPSATGTATATATRTQTSTRTPTETRTPTATAEACGVGSNYTVVTATATIEPATFLVPGSTNDDVPPVSVTLPFSFRFYDQTFTTARLDGNGNMQFTSSNYDRLNTCLPTGSLNNAIMGYWDDLDMRLNTNPPGVAHGIYTSTTGTAPDRIYNVEWRACRYMEGGVCGDEVNFQIRLYEGSEGKFEIVYGAVSGGGGSATVGVQKGTGSLFTRYSCDQAKLAEGLKLIFTQPSCGTATGTPTETNTATRTATSIGTSTSTMTVSTTSATTTATRTVTSTGTSSPTAIPTATACTLEFQDVPPSTEVSSFYPYVRCLACKGVLSGYPCGGSNPETNQPEPCGTSGNPYYRPSNQITRGQISKVVAGASDSSGDPGPQKYEDVPPSNPFYVWINRLSNEGVIGGYSCGSASEPCGAGNRPYFRPNANATRGQMSKIVSNAAGFDEAVSGQSFEDLPPSTSPSSYYVHVERLFVRGIVGGYSCGGEGEACGEGGRPYFRPNSPVTRGQAAKIAANTFFPQCSNTTRP
ncbi:MAG: alpha/beta hydrolase-fold protein [Chloroflexota bacterium]|nr:alpha/beta hydrolase-fold protein [Chloroflexota bacterium]